MANFHRRIVAGALVTECFYPALHPRDGDAVRQGKRNCSSEAQKRMNLTHAWQNLELILAANFVPGDLICVLTYDDAHLPKTRAEAVRNVSRFADRLRYARKEKPVVYAYNTEHLHKHEDYRQDGRWHHHFVVNATGDDYDRIRRCWGRGHVYFQKLRVDKEYHYERLARYMCKEKRDKLGHRLYSCSRNARKPDRETRMTENDFKITVPRSAMVLEDTGHVRTAYGNYRYVKYILPAYLGRSRRIRKRKK